MPNELDNLTVAELGALLATRTAETVATRQQAILALAALRVPEVIPLLGNALTQDPERGIRRISVGALEQVDVLAAVPYLQIALGDSDDITADRARYALATALPRLMAALDHADAVVQQQAGVLLQTLTIPTLQTILTTEELTDLTAEEQSAVKRSATIALGLMGNSAAVPILGEALIWPMQERGMVLALVTALEKFNDPQAIPFLEKFLRENPDAALKGQAARLLGNIPHPEAVTVLTRALVEQQQGEVRLAAEAALRRHPDWQQKAVLLIEALRNSGQERATLDSVPIIRALRPPDSEIGRNRHLLTDYLIEQAVAFGNDPRMNAIMAKLITDSADGIRNLAGERLNHYKQRTNTAEPLLQNLRFEIGGATALAPVATLLQEDLKTYFQNPIKELNEKTLAMWQDTIRLARLGFALRAGMSVILFIVGIYLTLSSYQSFLGGTLQTEGFFGAGVSFVGGLGLMLATVYSGPLKDIRKSVTDVGTANAAFIGYVHRVQQISHTFSFLYIQEQISPEQVESLGKLIEDAMGDTIRMLGDGERAGE